MYRENKNNNSNNNNNNNKESRLDNLYSDYLKDQSVYELLVDGLNAIENSEYDKLTKHST